MLDGIYALVLGPALTELLPRSGMEAVFSPRYLGRTITMSALLTIAIVGL
jgi:hypothetical protein